MSEATNTGTDPKSHRTTTKLAGARLNDTILYTQAIIKAIWVHDIDALPKIVGMCEIKIKFGAAATSELVDNLLQEAAEGTSPGSQESREALTDRCMLDVFSQALPHLTPLKLAFLVGVSDGVISLVSRQCRPRRELLQWCLGLGDVCIRQDTLTRKFFWSLNCRDLPESGSESGVEAHNMSVHKRRG